MKNILIPIDGSEFGDRAVEIGKLFAKAFNSNVVLLNVPHVVFPVYAYGYGVAMLDNPYEIYKRAQDESAELLTSVKRSFGEMSDKVEIISLKGNASEAIIDYINANNFDLIIMGSHGLGAILNRLLLGSVTTKVLHHVKTPVLVVK